MCDDDDDEAESAMQMRLQRNEKSIPACLMTNKIGSANLDQQKCQIQSKARTHTRTPELSCTQTSCQFQMLSISKSI